MRAYAATGDVKHYDNYWHEVEFAKNRDIAVEAMREIGITYHAGALVTEMYAFSNNLIPLEEEAVDLVAAGDMSGALEIVYGWSYENWIGRIRNTQAKFIEMLNTRTEEQMAIELGTARTWTVINYLCLVLTAFIQFLSTAVVRRKLILPILIDGVKKVLSQWCLTCRPQWLPLRVPKPPV